MAEVKATSNWKSVSGWSSNASGNTTSFSSSIEDTRLSSEVVSKGLVLVFMKKGENVVSLPFTEEGTKLNWHYQVSDNVLQIMVMQLVLQKYPVKRSHILLFHLKK